MYSTDDVQFKILNVRAADISFLPPWDRAVRAGLVSKGPPGEEALFRKFALVSE